MDHSSEKQIYQITRHARKASENKNAIFVFAFQTPQHSTHFG